ncbi:MAG TPA: hypothetical protein VMB05_10780 [Solirubrobacteraceae bacterium]|nr:hypothetical protein [Solirubrobacteraceae bacterium]
MPKRLTALLALLLFAVLALAPQALAAPAYVQSGSNSGSGTSLGVNYAGSVTAGDLLVGQFRTTGTTSVSDSVNGAWTKAVETTSEGVTHSIWYRANSAAGKPTVTVSAGATGSIRAILGEYSGLAKSGALDQTACNQGKTTAVTTGATASVGAGDLLYAAVGMFEHPRTITAGSSNGVSATLRTQFSGEFGSSGEEDVTSTAAGAQNASFTLSEGSEGGWAACAAAFRPETTEAAGPTCNKYASTAASGTENGEKTHPYKTVRKLYEHLAAGETGCLQEGQTFKEPLAEYPRSGSVGKPITISSTNVNNPATINEGFTISGNYNTFTHVKIQWEEPKPWACWNSEGNADHSKSIVFVEGHPSGCENKESTKESSPVVVIEGEHAALTYDDISSMKSTNCVIPIYAKWANPTTTAKATETLIEHDRIHDCGPPVWKAATTGFSLPDEEYGWHVHGVYDEGKATTVKNNYIYNISRNGIVEYTPETNCTCSHNVLYHNGNGASINGYFKEKLGPVGSVFSFNVITNSTSLREEFDWGVDAEDYPTGSKEVNSLESNILYKNLTAEIHEEKGVLKTSGNKEKTNPEFACGACEGELPNFEVANTYAAAGYGPESPPTKY